MHAQLRVTVGWNERGDDRKGFRARPCPGRKGQRFASASRRKGEEGKKASQGEDAGERERERRERQRQRQTEREKEEPGREEQKKKPDSGVSFTVRPAIEPSGIALIRFEKIIEIIEKIREGASWTITVV